MDADAVLGGLYELIAPHLTEKQRRLLAGAAAKALGRGGGAALIFYGTSMLLAARGYAGCAVLAVSNWLLRRDHQIGCAVFWPVDYLERRGRDATEGSAIR